MPHTGHSIDARLHPMPWDPPRHSAYIRTPKGTRRLTTEELAKGLGAAWIMPELFDTAKSWNKLPLSSTGNT